MTICRRPSVRAPRVAHVRLVPTLFACALAVCASGSIRTVRAEVAGPQAVAGAAVAPETRGGPAVAQGDILVAPATARRGLGYERDRLWPHGIVPVVLDPELSEDTVSAIDEAIGIWNAAAGIDIRPIEADAARGIDHVRFEAGQGCASWVGRRGGAQELWVARDCAAGSIVHELGHVLGLEHEHVRPDRDQWIEVVWENVVRAKRHNFDIARAGLVPLGDYDYDSIMHYGPDFFSVDGSATIRPLVGRPRIGQRVRPSAGDVDAIARLYGTDLALAGSLAGADPAASGGAELLLHITNEGPRGAHALELTLPPGMAVTAAVSSEAWSCETPLPDATPGVRVGARCALERLDAGARSTLALGVSGPGERAAVAGPIELALSSGSDDSDPRDDRLVLRAAARLDDAPTPVPAAAPEPAPEPEPALAASGEAANAAGGTASGPAPAEPSPFATVQTLAAAAAGRTPAPGASVSRAELVTIVASPDPAVAAAEEAASREVGKNRFERLFGGAGGGLLPLLGAAVALRRRGRTAPSRY